MTQKTVTLYDWVETGLQAVNDAMVAAVSSDVAILNDASHHILSAGGKRVRPRLFLLAYQAMGGTDVQHAAPVAAAIELMHTASVVHDDINDHGILRRGRPSVNAVWGRTFALLTGDYLFTTVYRLMAPYQDLNIDLAQAATALVEGETLQASAVKENNFTREIYLRIIELKTAALFRSAGVLGAKLAHATHSHVEALKNYAFNVGIAFQIVDDILDIIGDDMQLGKTSGIDIQQGRGIAATQGNGKASQQGAIAEKDPAESIKLKFMEDGVVDKVREQAQQLISLAIDSLDELPPSEARNELVELAYQVVNRDQ